MGDLHIFTISTGAGILPSTVSNMRKFTVAYGETYIKVFTHPSRSGNFVIKWLWSCFFFENTSIHNKPQKSKLLPKTQTPRGFYGLSFCIFCWHHSSNQWTESQRRTLCTFAGGSSFTAEWSAWGTTYMVVQSLSFIQILFQGSRCRHPLRPQDFYDHQISPKNPKASRSWTVQPPVPRLSLTKAFETCKKGHLLHLLIPRKGKSRRASGKHDHDGGGFDYKARFSWLIGLENSSHTS